MKKLRFLIYILLLVVTLVSCGENTPHTYEVVFRGYDGVVIHTEMVPRSKTPTAPIPPEVEGYSFTGWDKEFEQIQENVEIHAIYEPNTYRISYEVLGGLPMEDTEHLFASTLQLPLPAQEGYTFLGWYLDKEFQIPFTQNAMPASDLTLYARWTTEAYRIYYMENDEYLWPNQIYQFGDTISLPGEVEKEGFDFDYWCVDENGLERFTLETMPAYDIVLYPKWIAKTYRILYYVNDYETREETNLFFEETLKLWEPTKENLSFCGWYLDSERKILFEQTLMPSYDLTLYAKWESVLPFITAQGDQLYVEGEVFRFVSFNIPNLHIIEDPDWHTASAWEQEDAIKSIQLMGGRVTRIYSLSIVGGIRPLEGGNTLAHLTGPEQYNEELFKSLDKVLELAGKYGVYLIIPIIDEWNWFGGIQEFAAMYGKTRSQFFTDSTVKAGFKHLINYLLNRVNTYTGIKYKDDPAILAWELGNELRSATDSWIGEMASYVKQLDGQHLLLSGRDSVTTYDLNNSNIDMISCHYYSNGSSTFAQRAKNDRLKTVNKKPFIIGEFGLVSYEEISDLINESISNGTAGSLIWSLRFRNEKGGFYYHNDGAYRSYHYPGFALNDDYQERQVVSLIIEKAFYVQGLEPIKPPVPDAPLLFAIASGNVSWRGSTGAMWYVLERSSDGVNWVEIASEISDAGKAPFYVETASLHGLYYYRLRAYNESGYSVYSNIETCNY